MTARTICSPTRRASQNRQKQVGRAANTFPAKAFAIEEEVDIHGIWRGWGNLVESRGLQMKARGQGSICRLGSVVGAKELYSYIVKFPFMFKMLISILALSRF